MDLLGIVNQVRPDEGSHNEGGKLAVSRTRLAPEAGVSFPARLVRTVLLGLAWWSTQNTQNTQQDTAQDSSTGRATCTTNWLALWHFARTRNTRTHTQPGTQAGTREGPPTANGERWRPERGERGKRARGQRSERRGRGSMSDLELVNRKHWPHHQATGSKG